MKNNEKAGEVISLDEAINFTHSYQNENPDAIKAFLVDVNQLNLITQQDGCVQIRIYKGYDTTTKTNNLVLVGVNEQGDDMTDGVILERLLPCPPRCSSVKVLIK